jgi:signal peptidase II
VTAKEKQPKTTLDRPHEPRSRKALAICIAVTVGLLAADLGSKAWALDELSTERRSDPPPVCEPDANGYTRPQRLNVPEPLVVIEDHVELRYAENCGAAFGLLRNAPAVARHAVFGTAALAASLALLWMFGTGRGGRYFAWSVPFIVSGALGNLTDRLRLGYVVDFIRFHWESDLPLLGTQWPTFNIADVTITVGIVLLLIDGWQQGREEKAEERRSKEAATSPSETAEV